MANYKGRRLKPPAVCPVCGYDVPANALACPECGADHNSGWKEDATAYDGLDLPDDHFDYDEFVRREFGGSNRGGIKTIWWVTAILVLVVLVALYFLTNR
jgi:hypothetical protein